MFLGKGPMNGILGRAYTHKEGRFWIRPDTNTIDETCEITSLSSTKTAGNVRGWGQDAGAYTKRRTSAADLGSLAGEDNT